MSHAAISFDGNTAALLDSAVTIIARARDVAEAKSAGEFLDAVEALRRDLEREPVEDARLAVLSIADAWELARANAEADRNDQTLRVVR
jgi:hypothetical protein